MRRSDGFFHILSRNVRQCARIDPISARAVVSTSTGTWALPITFIRQRFVDVTIFRLHLPRSFRNELPDNAKSFELTNPSLNTVCRYIEVYPEMKRIGSPLLATNVFKLLIND